MRLSDHVRSKRLAAARASRKRRIVAHARHLPNLIAHVRLQRKWLKPIDVFALAMKLHIPAHRSAALAGGRITSRVGAVINIKFKSAPTNLRSPFYA